MQFIMFNDKFFLSLNYDMKINNHTKFIEFHH